MLENQNAWHLPVWSCYNSLKNGTRFDILLHNEKLDNFYMWLKYPDNFWYTVTDSNLVDDPVEGAKQQRDKALFHWWAILFLKIYLSAKVQLQPNTPKHTCLNAHTYGLCTWKFWQLNCLSSDSVPPMFLLHANVLIFIKLMLVKSPTYKIESASFTWKSSCRNLFSHTNDERCWYGVLMKWNEEQIKNSLQVFCLDVSL